MAETRDTYHTVTPYLVVPNADAELTFLKTAFGGTERSCQRRPDNTVMHAEVEIGDSLIMLGQAGGQWTPRSAALYSGLRMSTPPTRRPLRPAHVRE